MNDSNRFISLMSDYGFKIVFADESDTLFLRKSLQALIQSPYLIKEVEFLRHEFSGITSKGRGGIYDLFCKDEKGNHFIVEMQLGHYKNYVQRSKFYAFQKFNTIVKKGKGKFTELPKIYCIGLLAHNIFPKSELYYHFSTLKNQIGEEIDNQTVHIFVEIRKFKKQEKEINSDLDKLIFIMKNLEDIEGIKKKPLFMNEEWIDKALRKLDISKMTPDQRMFYEIALAKNASVKEMQEEREQKVRKEGKIEGKKEGKKEEREKMTKETAKKLKAKGWSLEEIAEFTGLEKSEIEKL